MARYFEDFTSYPTGPLAGNPNWTTRLALGAAQTNIVPDSTTSAPLMRVQGGSAGSRLNSYNPLDNATDIESLVKFRVNGVDTGRQGIVAHRYSGTSEATTAGYALQFVPASNVKSLLISNDQTGVTHNFTDYAWTANTIYWARFRTVGTAIQAKVWPDGAAEPATWLLDSVDTAFTGGPGTYNGVNTFSPNIYGVDYLQYSAATDGGSAPKTKQEQIDYVNSQIPSSTPILGFSGGFGGPFAGFGSALGLAKKNTELVIDSSLHGHTVTSPVLRQAHRVAIANATHAHAATSPAIKQLHNLLIANAVHSITSTSPVIAINHNLAVDSATHQIVSDNVLLVTGFAAVPQNAVHNLTSDSISLQQHQTLIIQSSTHAHTVTSPTIIEAKTLAISSTAHSLNDSGVGKLGITHYLAVASSSHSLTSTSPALTQSAILAVQNATHALTSTSVNIIQFTLLGKPDSTVHSLASDHISLSQQQILAIDSTMHLLKSEEIAKIFNWTEMNVAFGGYIPDRGAKGPLHEAEVQVGNIIPAWRQSGKLEASSVDEGNYKPNYTQKGKF